MNITNRRALRERGASLVAQRLKRLPGMQQTQVWSVHWEDPLEKEMATRSSTLAWRIPWREEPGGLLSTGSQRQATVHGVSSRTWLSDFTFTFSRERDWQLSRRRVYGTVNITNKKALRERCSLWRVAKCKRLRFMQFYKTALLHCYHLGMFVSLELHKPQPLTFGYSS